MEAPETLAGSPQLEHLAPLELVRTWGHATPARVPGIPWRAVADMLGPDCRVDAIDSYEQVGRDLLARLENRNHSVADELVGDNRRARPNVLGPRMLQQEPV